MWNINAQKPIRLGWFIALGVIFWQACSPSPQAMPELINDKLGHFLVFALLGLWAHIGWEYQKHRNRLFGVLVLYGMAIECVQYFVPGRYFSLLDWLMDILGLILALLLIKLHARTGLSRA